MAQLGFVSPEPHADGEQGVLRSIVGSMESAAAAKGHSLQLLSPARADTEPRVAACDLAIYEIGNDPNSYRSTYEAAVRHPGVVVLLDPDIGDLVTSFTEEGSELGDQAAREARAAVSQVLAASLPWDDSLPLPWCARLVRRSRAVVVADAADATYLRRFRCRTPIYVAPWRRVQPDPGRPQSPEQHTPGQGGDGSIENAARILGQAVEETLELLGDPIRLAVAAWARALSDCGGTVDGFRSGYGARYADALESLSMERRPRRLQVITNSFRGRLRPRRGSTRSAEKRS